MESQELEDVHLLATNVFQNVTTLTPLLRNLVANAKQYQKSFHGTCQFAQVFIESLSGLANAAKCAQGATKFVGDVLADIMDTYREIEGLKLELMKLFINEIIIPLESRAEQEISTVKEAHKGYIQENKKQTELVEKATQDVVKIRKKTQRRKSKTGKYDERERESIQTLKQEEKNLQDVRERGLRTALIEERRVYCFVADRMSSFGRGMVIYNNRISHLVNQKVPDWQAVIAKPTELPSESEALIKQPATIDTGTIRRKNEKKGTVKSRPPSTIRNDTGGAGLKFHTIDGRAASVGSRPALQRTGTPPVSPMASGNSPSRFGPPQQPESPARMTPPVFVDENEEGSSMKIADRSKTMTNALRTTLNDQLAQKLKQVHPLQKIELRAIYDHKGQDPSQLTFAKGDVIVPVCEPTAGWQYGENKSSGQAGWFPAAYVEKMPLETPSVGYPGTLPNNHGDAPQTSLSVNEERVKRYSSPARNHPLVLPEKDYDSDDSDTISGSDGSTIINGHPINSPAKPKRAIPSSASVPEISMKYMEQSQAERHVSLDPLVTAINSVEDPLTTSSQSSSTSDITSEVHYMPPPPPAPFSMGAENGDEYVQMDDGQSNPFANIRLKKTVTNDRSSPRLA